jgi:hypothetical protein
LIVGSNETLTGLGVSKLLEYANSGLPIVFFGGLPSAFEGYDQPGYDSANATISELTPFTNVHVTDTSIGLASFLQSINIAPRTAVSTNGTWYTYWRAGSGVDYIYIYNNAPDLPIGQGYSIGSITFASTGIPYKYDAWTGEIKPIVAYSQTDTHTTIALQMAGEQTTIIAFVSSGSRPFYVESIPVSTESVSTSSSSISVLVTADETVPVVLSNGTTIMLPAASASSFVLGNWSLTVESWIAPANLFDLNPSATSSNLSTFADIRSLESWQSISSSLTNVSGRGYYSTDFQWPPSGSIGTDTLGAFIDLGAIIHTAQVTINGQTLAPMDIAWARADIARYLVNGSNSIEVVVSTPLGNALRSVWDSIEYSGKTAESQVGDAPSVADYGLVFPVQIVPYQAYILSE